MSAFVVADTISQLSLYAMGLAILTEHCRTIAKAYLTSQPLSAKRQTDVLQSTLLIQGTGLEAIVENYGLEINPDSFRDTFYGWLTWQAHRQLVLSSATIRADSLNGVWPASSPAATSPMRSSL